MVINKVIFLETYQAIRTTVTMAAAPQWSAVLDGRGRAWNIFWWCLLLLSSFDLAFHLCFSVFLLWFPLLMAGCLPAFGPSIQGVFRFRFRLSFDFGVSFHRYYDESQTIELPLGQVLKSAVRMGGVSLSLTHRLPLSLLKCGCCVDRINNNNK